MARRRPLERMARFSMDFWVDIWVAVDWRGESEDAETVLRMSEHRKEGSWTILSVV